MHAACNFRIAPATELTNMSQRTSYSLEYRYLPAGGTSGTCNLHGHWCMLTGAALGRGAGGGGLVLAAIRPTASASRATQAGSRYGRRELL